MSEFDRKVERIARICHEANRGYQAAFPDPAVLVADQWDVFTRAVPDQAAGVQEGVRLALNGASSEELHRSWCDAKVRDGWQFGPEKSLMAKTHPCLLPYDELPEVHRGKDDLFRAIVQALA